MSIAIMQPYVFPYIGYFQLVNAVRKFIFLDDVMFIKGGWINRNNILVNRQVYQFTIPLEKVSQNVPINETRLYNQGQWKTKLLRTIEQAYCRAPMFEPVFTLIKSVFESQSEFISDLAHNSVIHTSRYLEIDVDFINSSAIYNNYDLKAEARIIDICLREHAKIYINPIGGRSLYNSNNFEQHGIDLQFLNPRHLKYSQFGSAFYPSLSIIDVLMFNTKEKCCEYLEHYELIK